MTAVGLLARHLTPANHREVLDAARHKSKREIERLVAVLDPRPVVPSSIRKVPTPPADLAVSTPAGDVVLRGLAASTEALDLAPPPKHAVVKPLAPERYRVQFTVGRETHEKLRRVQDLMRHTIPNGDPAEIFDKALTLLLEHLAKTKLAVTERPRAPRSGGKRSRHIPARVRRAVWKRDGGQCAFVGTSGRCTERGFLELHHVEPFAVGGDAAVENIQLRCRAHNAYEAEQYFTLEPWYVRERAPHWGWTHQDSVQTEDVRKTPLDGRSLDAHSRSYTNGIARTSRFGCPCVG